MVESYFINVLLSITTLFFVPNNIKHEVAQREREREQHYSSSIVDSLYWTHANFDSIWSMTLPYYDTISFYLYYVIISPSKKKP